MGGEGEMEDEIDRRQFGVLWVYKLVLYRISIPVLSQPKQIPNPMQIVSTWSVEITLEYTGG